MKKPAILATLTLLAPPMMAADDPCMGDISFSCIPHMNQRIEQLEKENRSLKTQVEQLSKKTEAINASLDIVGFGGMTELKGNEIWTLAMYGKTIEDQGHSYIIALNNEFKKTDNGCQTTCKKYDARFACRGFTYLGCSWGLRQPGTSKCESDGKFVCQPRVCLCSL